MLRPTNVLLNQLFRKSLCVEFHYDCRVTDHLSIVGLGDPGGVPQVVVCGVRDEQFINGVELPRCLVCMGVASIQGSTKTVCLLSLVTPTAE